jgi:hypothetical protein
LVVERGMSLGAHSFLWTSNFAGHEEHVFAQAAAKAHVWSRPTVPSAEVAAALIAHLRRAFADGPRP